MGIKMAPVEPDRIAYQTPEIKKLGNIKDHLFKKAARLVIAPLLPTAF